MDQELLTKPIQVEEIHAPVQEQTTYDQAYQPAQAQQTQMGSATLQREFQQWSQARSFDMMAAPIEITAKAPRTLSPQATLPKVNDKSQRKTFYKEQKKKAVTKADGLMSDDELASIESLRTSRWGTKTWMKEKAGTQEGEKLNQGQVYEQVRQGDYRMFEQLDVTLRNALATRFMKENFGKPLPGQRPSEYVRALKEKAGTQGLMNPLFRLGLSLAMRNGMGDIPPDYFRQMDDACGTELMVETLSRRIGDEDEDLLRQEAERQLEKEAQAKGVTPGLADLQVHIKSKEIRKSMEKSQIFMATNMLMMHLGNAQKKTTTKVGKNKVTNSTPWEGDMATAFTHCSRVAFVTPAFQQAEGQSKEAAQADYKKMWEHLRGKNAGGGVGSGSDPNEYGMFRRGGSTHSFKQRKVSGNSPFKEKKVVVNLFGQEGVNVAVGGLLNKGVGGQAIRMDGSCGHIYTMRKEEDADTCGGYLMGYESDAHTMTNQLGHTHGLGNGEYASSFGSQRTDEVGDKYGGREVDVSQVSVERINSALGTLRAYMDSSHSTGADTSEVMRRLAGRHMNEGELNTLLTHMREETTRQGGQ